MPALVQLVGETASSTGERYKAVAGVLTRGEGDARTAKAFVMVGEAWQTLSQNAAKHSCAPAHHWALLLVVCMLSALPLRHLKTNGHGCAGTLQGSC